MRTASFCEWTESILGGVDLFHGVDCETVLALGARAEWHRSGAGHALIKRGEICTSFFAIVDGAVRVDNGAGRPSDTREAGSTVGLRTAFRAEASPMLVVATTPVVAAEIARTDLLWAMTQSSALAVNVARRVSTGCEPLPPRQRLDTRILAALAVTVAADGLASGLRKVRQPIDPAVWGTLLDVDAADVRRALQRLERALVLRREADGRLYVDVEKLRARLA